MRDITEIMIQLIRSEVCQNIDMPIEDFFFDNQTLIDVLIMARKHGVAHLVASALLKTGILIDSPQEDLFLNELYSSVFLYEKLQSVFDKVCKVFEEYKISYIPLKGAVIRALYPEPWMRSSCDIDILIRNNELIKAENALIENCGCTVRTRTGHDVTFVFEDGIALELHFRLFENKKSSLYSDLLKDVWKYAEALSDNKYEYKLSESYFYYYHILHMAKHFKIGGCGLRPFIDLWLINNSENVDIDVLHRLLSVGKLSEFEETAHRLSNVWFSGDKHNDITLAMQNYIIEGGSFGTEKTRISAEKHHYSSKYRYVLSRIFVSKEYLQAEYPVVKECPILFPLFILIRTLSFVCGKKRAFAERQMSRITNFDNDKVIDLFDKLKI